jgi:hypothetical protein
MCDEGLLVRIGHGRYSAGPIHERSTELDSSAALSERRGFKIEKHQHAEELGLVRSAWLMEQGRSASLIADRSPPYEDFAGPTDYRARGI